MWKLASLEGGESLSKGVIAKTSRQEMVLAQTAAAGFEVRSDTRLWIVLLDEEKEYAFHYNTSSLKVSKHASKPW